jgi:sulfate adenylyltransferase subunit 1
MDLLRFFTAGNVDDGKSTLIGRLLYDSNSISTDIVETLTQQSKVNSGDTQIDLALLTDGLRAEREQGITIDVAYKFFETDKRKYIIADTPGHQQYTRNMFTGASTAELAIILVDARNGITEQTKRHSIICTLLGIPKILLCINKMDLVDYSEEQYNEIVSTYKNFANKLKVKSVDFIPVSALKGENVVLKGENLSWYTGKTLFDYLETIEINANENLSTRFRVQYVIRPQTDELHDYRGYAGALLSGELSVGQEVKIVPSGLTSTISKIEVNQNEVERIETNQPAIIHLKDNVDISRGLSIIPLGDLTKQSKELSATICWMDNQSFQGSERFIFQQQAFRTKAKIQQINSKIDINSFDQLAWDNQLQLNEIVDVELKLADEVLVDSFSSHVSSGSFILINEATNQTVAGGTIN